MGTRPPKKTRVTQGTVVHANRVYRIEVWNMEGGKPVALAVLLSSMTVRALASKDDEGWYPCGKDGQVFDMMKRVLKEWEV